MATGLSKDPRWYRKKATFACQISPPGNYEDPKAYEFNVQPLKPSGKLQFVVVC